MALTIIQIPAGAGANFAYLVFCPDQLQGVAIDPSFAADAVLAAAAERRVQIAVVANTHGHHDHTAGNAALLAATGARLAAHPADGTTPDLPLADGDTLNVGNDHLTVMHTPGHTPGSVTFVTTGAALTGDTLFVTRCGRADLAGSDVNHLYDSLQKLKALPPETVVYPGHDYGPRPVSTIGDELRTNPYLLCADRESFIKLRLG
jgi:glyoxylase-like metal-dependent hydrolase (beta-lactamase superfamily II)